MDNKAIKEMMITELEKQRDDIVVALNGRINELYADIRAEKDEEAMRFVGKCFLIDGETLHIVRSFENKSDLFEVLTVYNGLHHGEGMVKENWHLKLMPEMDLTLAKDEAQEVFWSNCRQICRELFGEVDEKYL